MEVTRSYEIKLKPNKTQRRKLDQYFEEAKYFFNYVLQQNSDTIFDWTLYKHVDICRLDKEEFKTLDSLIERIADIIGEVIRGEMNSLFDFDQRIATES